MPQLRLYAAKLIKINVKKKKEVHSFGFLKKKKKKKKWYLYRETQESAPNY